MNGIQQIKPNGKLLSKPGPDPLPQQTAGLGKHQVLSRGLQSLAVKRHQKTVFLRHSVKAPGIVGTVFRQLKMFLHPVSAPHARIEIGYQPKGLRGQLQQSSPIGIPIDQAGFSLGGQIQVKIQNRQQLVFPFFHLIRPAPLSEVAPLATFPGWTCLVWRSASCPYLSGSAAEFPSG